LALSNGRDVTTASLTTPASLGGGAGLYYQVAPGPSPIPTSLAELDAHGTALRQVNLPPVVECTKEPFKSLPGGVQVLATGRVPGGPQFSITAQRYLFLGKVYFTLTAGIDEHGEREGGGAGSFSPQGSRELEWNTQEGCKEQPYARWSIVFGLLRSPGDAPFARTGGRTFALTRARIPAYLHPRGVLAYTVLPQQPTEVWVRSPAGRTVSDERLNGLPEGQCEPGSSSGIGAIGP
jgi:hypothetical protein